MGRIQQAGYSLARMIHGGGDVLVYAAGVGLTLHAFPSVLSSPSPLISKICLAGLSVAATTLGTRGIFSALTTRLYLAGKISTPHTFPQRGDLENAEHIIINDTLGLQKIIDITAQALHTEWGACLRAHAEKDTIIIDEIPDPTLMLSSGFLRKQARCSITWNLEKVATAGYNGLQHFHPNDSPLSFWSGTNYDINFTDRAKPVHGVHLLTFNTLSGPEVIGFTRKKTFLPTNPAKTHFVQADSSAILHYLA